MSDHDGGVLVDLRLKKAHVAQAARQAEGSDVPFPSQRDSRHSPCGLACGGSRGEGRSEGAFVEFLEALHDGDGNKVIAPYISDHPFRPALLMGGSRVAEAGLEVVVGLKFAEALLFDPVPWPVRTFSNGALQVVVHNGGKDTAEEVEGMDMGVEEGLLLLAGIGAYEGLAGELGVACRRSGMVSVSPALWQGPRPQSASASLPHSGSRTKKAPGVSIPSFAFTWRTYRRTVTSLPAYPSSSTRRV